VPFSQSGRCTLPENKGFLEGVFHQFFFVNWCKYHTFLVRGEIKKNFSIKYLSTNIIDIDIGRSLIQLLNFFTNCRIHKKKLPLRCSLNNLFKLFVFLENNNYEIYSNGDTCV